ncbi:MAG: MATE family efflux transporter [Methanomassiliicoccaceae archaeon]|nr:MATE family efflux transporter [Methanomassiliicoccaceae archaeon]
MTDGEPKTKDVEIMLGSPKRAIRKMAVPMIIALLASSVNGLVDAAWISGLGPDALAAIALLFPLFFITIGVSSGISVGASSAIARHIGAGNKDAAERTASVALTMTIVAGIVFSVIMFFAARPLMMAIGGASVIDYCMDYANVLFIFATAFFINALMSSILRSEGNAKRSMIIMVLAALLNLVLDPIFIYTFGWGMAGAALATAVALTVATLPAVYWFFVKKDTYIRLRIGKPYFDRTASKDIFRVGIPASFEFMAISIAVLLMNIILVNYTTEGTDAAAIYSAGWRLLNVIMIPCLAIGAALVPICAAAYGAKDEQKVRSAYMYSIKLSVVTMVILAVALFVFADIASAAFTYSEDTAYLRGSISHFIRISCTFLPFIGFGILSSSLFQAMGMGTKALLSTVFRNFVILPPAFLVSLSGSLTDIWWCTAIMEIIGPIVVLVWCLFILKALTKRRPIRSG